MAPLIGVAWLLLMALMLYRAGKVLLAARAADTSVAGRPGCLSQRSEATAPDTPAEAQEGELASQLLAGTIDPATYRCRMSELASASDSQTGGRR